MKSEMDGGSQTMETFLKTRYEVSYLKQENGQWVPYKLSNDGKGFDIHEAMDKMREISAVDGRSMGFEIRKIRDD